MTAAAVTSRRRPRPWENGFAVACSQMNFTDGT